MTDNELIRELESDLKKAFDIIRCQKTEIDILIRKKETLRDEIAELQLKIASCNSKIEELEGENLVFMGGVEYFKSEAIKQFIREFEKRCISGGIYPAFVKQQLYDVEKEMVGDMK